MSCYWKTATSATRNSGIKLPEQVRTRREGSRQLTSGAPPSLDAVAAADRVAEWVEAAVNEAKAEAAVNDAEAMAAQSSSKQDAERGRAEIATHGTGAACSGRESRPEQLEQFPYDQRWSQTRVGRWLQVVWHQVGSRHAAALASHFSLVACPGPAVTSGPTGPAPPRGTLDISPQAGGRAWTLLGRHLRRSRWVS